MKPKRTNLASLIPALAAFALAAGSASAAVTLIDKSFDLNDLNDIGPTFQGMNNGTSSGSGSVSTTTGLITMGGNNNARALNNTATVNIAAGDPTATGFSVTFEVDATTATAAGIAGNGLFLGIVSGTGATGNTTTWNNAQRSFGYILFSGGQRGSNNMYQIEDGVTNAFSSLGGAPTGFADGFTVTISLFNDDTWTVTSTGFDTNNLNGSGSLANTLTYADFASVGTYAGLQVTSTGTGQTLDMSRITLVTIPEPSTALLGGLGLLALLRRRR